MSALVERLRAQARTKAVLETRNRQYFSTTTKPVSCSPDEFCEWQAADRIEELEQAARLVEEWWLEQGSAHFAGAPYAIFALRSALSDSTPSLLEEQNANGGKEGE